MDGRLWTFFSKQDRSLDGKAWFKLGTQGGAEVSGIQYSRKDCYEEALKCDPTYAVAWYDLGFHEGGGEVAGIQYSRKACYEEALKCDPTRAIAWGNLGFQGGGEVAGIQYSKLDCFRESVKHKPDHAEAVAALQEAENQAEKELREAMPGWFSSADSGRLLKALEQARQVGVSQEKLRQAETQLQKISPKDTFEGSPFKQVRGKVQHPEFDSEVTMSVRDFLKQLPKNESSATSADCDEMFRSLDTDCKKRLITEIRNAPPAPPGGDHLSALTPEAAAEVMWTSPTTLRMCGGNREFCWIVNWCIRSGILILLQLLMPFFSALNHFAAPQRKGGKNLTVPWEMLTGLQLFRGGGFNMDYKDFFTTGKQFRIPGFWATTPTEKIAKRFIERADYPPVRWTINIDGSALCWHVSFISRSLVHDYRGKPQENEFLFTHFSVFTVEYVSWKPCPTPSDPHEIHVKAFPDNDQAPAFLPLAPWS